MPLFGELWTSVAAALAILVPLVAVPLTVITFYLKGLRDQQTDRYGDLAHRVALADAARQRLHDDLVDLRRDYTTKEEWLRESMWARGQIEKLRAAASRTEALLEQLDCLPADVARCAQQLALLTAPRTPADEDKE